MSPFLDTDVWTSLSPRHRRRVTASLAWADIIWRYYRVPGLATPDLVATFGREHLLRGFFARPARILVALTGRPIEDGLILGVGLAPPPVGVRLPAWGLGFDAAVRQTFASAVDMKVSPSVGPSTDTGDPI